MNSLQIPNFTCTGTHKKDYYLVNGSPNFAHIPAGIAGVEQAMPIRLPYGDVTFGALHIMRKHGKWVQESEESGCVATLVWRKLSQRGGMFIERDSKLNLSLKINPSALLILKQLDGFYSVTTLYHHQRAPKGKLIGTYQGQHWINLAQAAPEPDQDGAITEVQVVAGSKEGRDEPVASGRDAEGATALVL